MIILFFFFQAEDGIRDWSVTGVQTCALPISKPASFLRIRANRQFPRGRRRYLAAGQISGVPRSARCRSKTIPAPAALRVFDGEHGGSGKIGARKFAIRLRYARWHLLPGTHGHRGPPG